MGRAMLSREAYIHTSPAVEPTPKASTTTDQLAAPPHSWVGKDRSQLAAKGQGIQAQDTTRAGRHDQAAGQGRTEHRPGRLDEAARGIGLPQPFRPAGRDHQQDEVRNLRSAAAQR